MRPSALLSRGDDRSERDASAARGGYQSHLRDAVFGAVDGTVTTFAVVAGAIGADLPAAVVLVLGLANLFADGLSMAVGNYLAERADAQGRHHAELELTTAIRTHPDEERARLRTHFASLSVPEEDLDPVVASVTADPEAWRATMMHAQFGPSEQRDPRTAAFVVYLAFLGAGSIPLSIFIVDALGANLGEQQFLISAVATGCTFFGVGALKGLVVGRRWWRDGIETFALGGAAAAVAFAVGWLLRGVAEGA